MLRLGQLTGVATAWLMRTPIVIRVGILKTAVSNMGAGAVH
jgi:hypothetical protein